MDHIVVIKDILEGTIESINNKFFSQSINDQIKLLNASDLLYDHIYKRRISEELIKKFILQGNENLYRLFDVKNIRILISYYQELNSSKYLQTIKKSIDKLCEIDEVEVFYQLLSRINNDRICNLLLEEMQKYQTTRDDLNFIYNGYCNKRALSCYLNLQKIKIQNSNELEKKVKELLRDFINTAFIFKWLRNNNYHSIVENYVLEHFKENPSFFINYVEINGKIISMIKEVICKYPDLIKYVDIHTFFQDKQEVLKYMEVNSKIYDELDEKYRYDFDIARIYVKMDKKRLLKLEEKVDKYFDLCYRYLEKNGILFKEMTNLHSNEKALDCAMISYPEALFYADEQLQTRERLAKINYNNLDLKTINYQLLLKIFELKLLNINDSETLKKYYIAIAFRYHEIKEVITDKMFINKFFLVAKKLPFRIIVANLLGMDDSKLPKEYLEIKKNSKIILDATKNYNTLEANTIFEYKLVSDIYPLLGLDNTLKLLKYNTNSDQKIISLIENGESDLVLNYYNFIQKKQIFDNDDKCIHYAFRYFSSFEPLIKEILSSVDILSKDDINNLKKIILNNNPYKINTLQELKEYDQKVELYLKGLLEKNDIDYFKEYLAIFFGYNDYNDLKKDFMGFGLDNFSTINSLYQQLNLNNQEKVKKLTIYEIKIILLLKRIIEIQDTNELKEYIIANKLADYSLDVQEIIAKIRLLYNCHLNQKLSDINTLKGNRQIRKQKIRDYKGDLKEVTYELIDADDDSFLFLSHLIGNLSDKYDNFKNLLIEDPSLWYRLYGDITISTSTISERYFSIQDDPDEQSIIYLFNQLPDSFLLYMYYGDAYVDDNYHRFNIKCDSNYFMDIDCLIEMSCCSIFSYNEIAGFRKNMKPCAIACFNEPTLDQIKAADYFKVPIIRFHPELYERKNNIRYEQSLKEFINKPTLNTLYNIFYSGKGVTDDLNNKVNICITSLINNYKKKTINYFEVLKYLIEMKKIISKMLQQYTGDPKQIKKIQSVISLITVLNNVSKDDIIKLESLDIDKLELIFKENNQNYLLKQSSNLYISENQQAYVQIQKIAYELEKMLNCDGSVFTEIVSSNNLKIIKKEKVESDDDKNILLSDWIKLGGNLDNKYTLSLLKYFIIDFLLCNIRNTSDNFVIDQNDKLRCIDRKLCFKRINDLNTLNFNFINYGKSFEPTIYKLLFDEYYNGLIDLDLDELLECIEKIKAINDEDYKMLFLDYAITVDKENYEQILDKIVERKNKGLANIEDKIISMKGIRRSK